MRERKIYQEIPGGKNSFHSAILTSFSFNFHHFENQVLRSLKQKWITSINILVDQRMLDDLLGLSSGNLKTISQTYAVSGIKSQGVFHPKINFFLGDEKILVLFGSGNISPGGHGKNHELFTGFYADIHHQEHLSLILEIWEYLKDIGRQLEGYSADRISKILPGACILIKKHDNPKHQYYKLNKNDEVALLYNDKVNINQQFVNVIPVKTISRITVICPYFDGDGSTLILLATQFPNATVDVYLQKDFGLPPVEMPPNRKIKFYDFDNTLRGQEEISGKNKYIRQAHSKIFHFKSDLYEYCFVGSANATQQAIGSQGKKSVNEEFGALYKSNSIDFLKELGISGRKKEVNVYSLKRASALKGDMPSNKQNVKIRIKSIDLNGTHLKVYLLQNYDLTPIYLQVFNLNGETCFRLPVENPVQMTIGFRLSDDAFAMNPQYCAFTNEVGGVISNKQLINNLHKLYNTNPSRENRSIRQIISTIEGGGYNEFEIVDFLNQIGVENQRSKNNNLPNGNTNDPKIEEEIDASSLTYEEAVIAARHSKEPLKILNSNPSSRLWQSIEQLFETKSTSIAEELMDEEEEGEANTSRKREVEEKEVVRLDIKSIAKGTSQLRSVEKMVYNYIEALKKIKTNQGHKIDTIDYHQFLLVSYILTSICCFAEYTLPKGISEIDWREDLDAMYEDLMISVLKEFALLHFNHTLNIHDSENEELVKRQHDAIQKSLYHVLLNITLILRKNSHPVLEDQICLIVLNLYKKCGRPDERLEIYLEKITKTYQNSVISLNQVNRTKDFFNNLLAEANPIFINTDLYGYCKIIENRNPKYKVKTLFGIYEVHENRLQVANDPDI